VAGPRDRREVALELLGIAVRGEPEVERGVRQVNHVVGIEGATRQRVLDRRKLIRPAVVHPVRMRKAIVESVRLFERVFEPSGPIVELGSYYPPGHPAFSDLRELFPGVEYVGCDLRSGPGVDRIEDAQDLSFADASFGTAFLFEILEHLPRPQRAIEEAHRVLGDDGLLALSVPFDYRLHAFPVDYWRFTPSGIALLLEPFEETVIFALGPKVKPAMVFAVAAKRSSSEFAERSARFRELVEASFRTSRWTGRRSAFRHRAHEFGGLLTGRAHLSVQFFDGPAEVPHPSPPAVSR
jgi:SAM-dependent methyltransferase